eukprot:gene13249-15569_t
MNTTQDDKKDTTPSVEETTAAATTEQTATPNKAKKQKPEAVSMGEITNSNDDHIEKTVLVWMKEQLNIEIKRIKTQGATCVALEVKNTGTVKDDGLVINRLEVKTVFDFDNVQNIMVSDSVECPHKKGYHYINSKDNKLTDWIFINDELKRSQHKIEAYEVVA